MKVSFTAIYIILAIFHASAMQMTEFNGTHELISIKSELINIKEQLDRQQRILDNPRIHNSYARNCENIRSSGIFEVLIPSFSDKPFRVPCDGETRGGGWTVILRRSDGTENFHRSWNVYKKGFGNLDGEFFLGLDKIHALTSENAMELLVLLEDFDNAKRSEIYERFGIAGEEEDYALNTLSKGVGDAGDSFEKHFKMKWSTFDRVNDLKTAGPHCGPYFKSGWWYHDCHESLLTGEWGNHVHGHGINWFTFRGHKQSMKKAVMMLRPRII